MEKLINNKLNKNTKFYSVIIGATPSKGARSPVLWNKVYKSLKIPCKMYPFDVDLNNLKKLINYLKNDKNFVGGSVTVPYKEKIIKFLDGVSKESKEIGSVNTLIKIGDKIIGDNTDFFGASVSLKKFKNKKKILILGCGGAGKAVILACFKIFKKASFFIFNRDYKKSSNFLHRLKKKSKIKNLRNLNNLKDLDLIINTTSIGFESWLGKRKKYKNLKFFSPLAKINRIKKSSTKNKEFVYKNLRIISQNNLKSLSFLAKNNKASVFDIIYNPVLTKFLSQASLLNMETKNGFEMNIYQAIKSFMMVNKIKKEKNIKELMIGKNG